MLFTIRFKISNPSIIDPEYDEFMAFCYIDINQGISFHIWGGIKDNKLVISRRCAITLRYSDDIILEIYETTEEGIIDYDLALEARNTPPWIEKIRKDTDYDPFRSKQFPDDLLLPTQTMINGKNEGECIWIRPYKTEGDCLVGRTIEKGNIIPIDTEVYILKKTDNTNFPIIAVTTSILKYLKSIIDSLLKL